METIELSSDSKVRCVKVPGALDVESEWQWEAIAIKGGEDCDRLWNKFYTREKFIWIHEGEYVPILLQRFEMPQPKWQVGPLTVVFYGDAEKFGESRLAIAPPQ